MSSEKVVPLKLVSVGNAAELDCDQILECAKGKFKEIVIVGISPEGQIDVRSSHGLADAVWMLEAGKMILMEMSFES